MKFDNEVNIDNFIETILEKIENNVNNIQINDIDIALGEDYGFSLAGDDRVPPKNIAEIKDREKIALAYEKSGNMDMAAIEWEECAREFLWNCICATCNISNKNIQTITEYLSNSKKSWFKFSGNSILPSQAQSY